MGNNPPSLPGNLEWLTLPHLDRKPVDPPPIIQLKVSAKKDPMQNYLQSENGFSPLYHVSSRDLNSPH